MLVSLGLYSVLLTEMAFFSGINDTFTDLHLHTKVSSDKIEVENQGYLIIIKNNLYEYI